MTRHLDVPVYVVNLDHATDRLNRISGQLKRQGVPFRRWRATPGDELEVERFGKADLADGIFVRGFRKWSRNEAACGVSHIRLLQHIASSSKPWSLVLEDDAEIIGDIPKRASDLGLPEDADLVLVNERSKGDDLSQGPYQVLVGGAGTEGYMVSCAGAAKLLTVLYPLKDPLDFQVFAHCEGVQAMDGTGGYWRLPQNPDAQEVLLKAYRFARPIVCHDRGNSTIGGQRHPRARFYCRHLLGLKFDNEPIYGVLRNSGSSGSASRTKIPEIRGVDISHFSARQYYTEAGEGVRSPFELLASKGVNCARISVWVGTHSQHNAERGLMLARLARSAGMRVYLALHFSDSWADPSHQRKPADWRGLSRMALLDRVAAYSAEIYRRFADQGTPPAIVQIGNETTNGFLWNEPGQSVRDGGCLFSHVGQRTRQTDDNWSGFVSLVNAAATNIRRQARAFRSDCDIALQIDKGAWPDVAAWWFENAISCDADFDVIALSYYPLWHEPATIPGLNHLAYLAATHPDKSIVIAETSYPYRLPEGLDVKPATGNPPFTKEGQRRFLYEMLKSGRQIANFCGVIWWGAFFNHNELDRVDDVFCAQSIFDKNQVALPVVRAFGATS